MLRCNEVTRLYSTDEIHRASLRKRLAVRIHLTLCRHCRRYVRELAVIGDAVRRAALDVPEEGGRLEAMVRRVLPDTESPEE